jgi:hypothetical protein
MDRGLDEHGPQLETSLAQERDLLESMTRSRYLFAGRDPQMPPALWDGQEYQVVFPDGVSRRVPAPVEPVVPLPIPLSPVAHPY